MKKVIFYSSMLLLASLKLYGMHSLVLLEKPNYENPEKRGPRVVAGHETHPFLTEKNFKRIIKTKDGNTCYFNPLLFGKVYDQINQFLDPINATQSPLIYEKKIVNRSKPVKDSKGKIIPACQYRRKNTKTKIFNTVISTLVLEDFFGKYPRIQYHQCDTRKDVFIEHINKNLIQDKDISSQALLRASQYYFPNFTVKEGTSTKNIDKQLKAYIFNISKNQNSEIPYMWQGSIMTDLFMYKKTLNLSKKNNIVYINAGTNHSGNITNLLIHHGGFDFKTAVTANAISSGRTKLFENIQNALPVTKNLYKGNKNDNLFHLQNQEKFLLEKIGPIMKEYSDDNKFFDNIYGVLPEKKFLKEISTGKDLAYHGFSVE